jgi:hypothetical protein
VGHENADGHQREDRRPQNLVRRVNPLGLPHVVVVRRLQKEEGEEERENEEEVSSD